MRWRKGTTYEALDLQVRHLLPRSIGQSVLGVYLGTTPLNTFALFLRHFTDRIVEGKRVKASCAEGEMYSGLAIGRYQAGTDSSTTSA